MPDLRTLLACKIRRPRRLTAGALVAIVLGVFFSLTSGRGNIPLPKVPDPNGYNDLLKAGRLVKGPWPGDGDFAKLDPASIRPFLEANKPTLDLARVGLSRECMIPPVLSQADFARHVEGMAPIRAISRLLLGEARVAEADGRVADTLKAYREMLALGQAASQGGMGIDVMVGRAIHFQAIRGLRQIRERLNRKEVVALQTELETLVGRLVTPDAVQARWEAWYRGSQNPYIRLMMRVRGLEQSTRAMERGMAETATTKTRRDLRFLLVELAIHAHHLDKGTWPHSVAELVPAYLPAVPIDPATNRPLDYPANPAGELTGDLSTVASPDGELTRPGAAKP